MRTLVYVRRQRWTSSHGHARKREEAILSSSWYSLAMYEKYSIPLADGPLDTQDMIQLNISCPSDKEEEKPTKDIFEKEDKDKKAKEDAIQRPQSRIYQLYWNRPTPKKNPRNRMRLLKIEQEILKFINDKN